MLKDPDDFDVAIWSGRLAEYIENAYNALYSNR